MNAKQKNRFGIGKLCGLDWAEIEGHAAEVAQVDGDVTYRGKFLCTVFNDDGGGDQLDADGKTMTDAQIQRAIDQIDRIAG